MSFKPVFFRCSGATYRAWCTACSWSLEVATQERDVRPAQGRVRKAVRKHVKETGHDVRTDSTRQSGYRGAESG